MCAVETEILFFALLLKGQNSKSFDPIRLKINRHLPIIILSLHAKYESIPIYITWVIVENRNCNRETLCKFCAVETEILSFLNNHQRQGDHSLSEIKFPDFSLTFPWPDVIFPWPNIAIYHEFFKSRHIFSFSFTYLTAMFWNKI